MKTLVDTCVLSELRRRGGSARVRERVQSLDESDVCLSALTMGELKKGIDKLRASAKKRSLAEWFDELARTARDRILPIDQETAIVWGEISAKLERSGRPIPAIDGLIAATALRHGLHLMTRNTADFEPTGVLLINPWE